MYISILAQSFMQVVILMLVLLTGHLFIPESSDTLDQLAGFNWHAKYSN